MHIYELAPVKPGSGQVWMVGWLVECHDWFVVKDIMWNGRPPECIHTHAHAWMICNVDRGSY